MGGLFIFVCFFRGRFWIFLGVPGSMFSCFSDFLFFCFSARLTLLLCFSCFSAFLLFTFPASVFFPASLLFCFCFSCFFAFLLLFSLLLCFCTLCLSTATILLFLFFCHVPVPLLRCFLSLLPLCFSFSFALFCSVCIPNQTLERP